MVFVIISIIFLIEGTEMIVIGFIMPILEEEWGVTAYM